jgi:hypothetical protein
LYIEKTIFVEKVNNEDVKWYNSNIWTGNHKQVVRMPPGRYTFQVKYSDGNKSANSSSLVTAQLENGNTYILTSRIHTGTTFLNLSPTSQRVTYHISKYDGKKEGDEVTINQLQNIRLLNPDDIVGRILYSFDQNIIHRLKVNQDGTFQYSKNENIYNGTWIFDGNARMYRYVFEWIENGEKQGYIMDFTLNEGVVTWNGRWTVTNAQKSFLLRLTFIEIE